MTADRLMTRRDWLTLRAYSIGAPWAVAVESVASVALAHPEIDMDEVRTLDEWRRVEQAAS